MMPSVKINLKTKLKRSEKMSVCISLGVNLPGNCSFSLKSEKADKHREVLPRRGSLWVFGMCETERRLHQRRSSGVSPSAVTWASWEQGAAYHPQQRPFLSMT